MINSIWGKIDWHGKVAKEIQKHEEDLQSRVEDWKVSSDLWKEEHTKMHRRAQNAESLVASQKRDIEALRNIVSDLERQRDKYLSQVKNFESVMVFDSETKEWVNAGCTIKEISGNG